MAPPLSGVTVVDLTTFLAGPYATQLLADLGADVIKVEPPDGDPSRAIPPHFIDGDSAYYLSVNRNKRSVVLDLKSVDGRGRLLSLLDKADVLFESYRPGVMTRLGLDEATLRARRPALVTCSITGFGLEGPESGRGAYDAIVQAMSGGMSITGEPGGRPVRAGVPLGDVAAGMVAAMASTAALLRARQTGVGAHVDVSMLDVQISMLTYQAAYYLLAGATAGPQGTGHVSIPTYRSFRCRDGKEVMVTANTERMWQGLCRAMGLGGIATDERFRTNASRLYNKADLWSILERAFAAGSSTEILARLEAESVPAAPVQTIADALESGHATSRGLVVSVAGRSGPRRFVGAPFRLMGEPTVPPRWPPSLGQDQEIVEEVPRRPPSPGSP